MKKRRGAGENSPIKRFIGRVYKGIGYKFSEFVARFYGTRYESLRIVVFKNGIVKEIAR